MNETKINWVKSSRSQGFPPECLEAAAVDEGRVFVRDSKDTSKPYLHSTRKSWDAFVGSAL